MSEERENKKDNDKGKEVIREEEEKKEKESSQNERASSSTSLPSSISASVSSLVEHEPTIISFEETQNTLFSFMQKKLTHMPYEIALNVPSSLEEMQKQAIVYLEKNAFQEIHFIFRRELHPIYGLDPFYKNKVMLKNLMNKLLKFFEFLESEIVLKDRELYLTLPFNIDNFNVKESIEILKKIMKICCKGIHITFHGQVGAQEVVKKLLSLLNFIKPSSSPLHLDIQLILSSSRRARIPIKEYFVNQLCGKIKEGNYPRSLSFGTSGKYAVKIAEAFRQAIGQHQQADDNKVKLYFEFSQQVMPADFQKLVEIGRTTDIFISIKDSSFIEYSSVPHLKTICKAINIDLLSKEKARNGRNITQDKIIIKNELGTLVFYLCREADKLVVRIGKEEKCYVVMSMENLDVFLAVTTILSQWQEMLFSSDLEAFGRDSMWQCFSAEIYLYREEKEEIGIHKIIVPKSIDNFVGTVGDMTYLSNFTLCLNSFYSENIKEKMVNLMTPNKMCTFFYNRAYGSDFSIVKWIEAGIKQRQNSDLTLYLPGHFVSDSVELVAGILKEGKCKIICWDWAVYQQEVKNIQESDLIETITEAFITGISEKKWNSICIPPMQFSKDQMARIVKKIEERKTVFECLEFLCILPDVSIIPLILKYAKNVRFAPYSHEFSDLNDQLVKAIAQGIADDYEPCLSISCNFSSVVTPNGIGILSEALRSREEKAKKNDVKQPPIITLNMGNLWLDRNSVEGGDLPSSAIILLSLFQLCSHSKEIHDALIYRMQYNTRICWEKKLEEKIHSLPPRLCLFFERNALIRQYPEFEKMIKKIFYDCQLYIPYELMMPYELASDSAKRQKVTPLLKDPSVLRNFSIFSLKHLTTRSVYNNYKSGVLTEKEWKKLTTKLASESKDSDDKLASVQEVVEGSSASAQKNTDSVSTQLLPDELVDSLCHLQALAETLEKFMVFTVELNEKQEEQEEGKAAEKKSEITLVEKTFTLPHYGMR